MRGGDGVDGGIEREEEFVRKSMRGYMLKDALMAL